MGIFSDLRNIEVGTPKNLWDRAGKAVSNKEFSHQEFGK
jgi:hypothetical protein